MTHATTTGGGGGAYGLWRWLAGGLATGAVILGLMVAAYAVGYNRGEDHAGAGTAAATTTAPAATTTTSTTPSAVGPVTVTPALVARGKALYAADGCIACHSLAGAAGVGPPLDGLAGTTVTLADGSTVAADDAYLEQSITDADAKIVKGYHAGVMAAAVAPHDLAQKPDDVRALVAYLKSNR